jgi:adenosylhomocysteine nucleosidase
MKILILATLRQEHSPLRKLLPGRQVVRGQPVKEFAFKLPDKEVVLLESGMGAEWAEKALQSKMPGFMPDLLIFSGFAGGLHPDLKIGSVCLTVRAREKSGDGLYNFSFPKDLDDFLFRNQIIRVMAISSGFPENKKDICSLADGQMAVLDMETVKVAEIALERNVPFVCFRDISDCLHHDLEFNLDDICDGRGRVSLLGVFMTVLKRPSLAKAFFLSWRRSRVAADTLCRSVAAFVRIPADALVKMAKEIRVER